MADKKEVKETSESIDKQMAEFSKIQAVKELIFGEEIQDYSQNFDKINEHFQQLESALKSEVESRNAVIADLTQKMETLIKKLSESTDQKFAKMDDKKVDRAKLGKMLVQMGEKLQA